MNKLKNLQKCKSRKELAGLLGFTPAGMSYVLYQLSDEQKYSEFQILKKSGGYRVIQKPCPQLKHLQRCLADYLYDCLECLKPNDEQLEVFYDSKNPNSKRIKRAISHGYEKGLSIATNARMHTGKRYVYNIDIKSFFPSFNFGRVRGYFLNNKKFRLHPSVATVIAQIACHKNQLPQGSPCSPVISNLICKSLDSQLSMLAKKNGCTYTRYVDDITFSSNKSVFPRAIARKRMLTINKEDWVIGGDLKEIVSSSGFIVNPKKCRMQNSQSRQEVTGLIVNKKVNVSSDYYRNLRSMCNSAFNKGYFYKKKTKTKNTPRSLLSTLIRMRPKKVVVEEKEICISLNVLQGMLAHVYNIRKQQNRFARKGRRPASHDGINTKNNGAAGYLTIARCDDYKDENHVVALDGIKNLYGRLIFFKNFYLNERPMLVFEGKTDHVYFKCAAESLASKFPVLYGNEGFGFSCFNRSSLNNELLRMAEGSSGLTYLVKTYRRFFSRFKSPRDSHPVIIIVDNDGAGQGVDKAANKIRNEVKAKIGGSSFRHSSFYKFNNLYVVDISAGADSKSVIKDIEDLFDGKTRQIKLDGKSFNGNNNIDPDKEYGKVVFAEKVVRANKAKIDFSGFESLLGVVSDIVTNHSAKNEL